MTIYCNNAATTWPKPEIVYETVDQCFRGLNSPSRTISDEGSRNTEMMQTSRAEIAEFLSIRNPNQLIFTPSATYSLNLAILGLEWREGDEIIMSGLEHHAVSRPIRKVAKQHGVKFHVAPYQPEMPIDLNFVEDTLKTGKVKLIASTMASNVTGDILPSIALGDLAERYGAMYLVDAAQSAGVISVDVEELKADMLSIAGHKGLFGPPGVGALYVRKGIQLETLAEGGTGKDSGKHEMSGRYPSNYEVGTHNLLSIAGMTAGVKWIQQSGLSKLREHEMSVAGRFLERVRAIDGVTIYGGSDIENRTAVVSITMEDCSPVTLSSWLAEEHNVSTRAGYHCAPGAHETIGTLPGEGTVRFSFSFANTVDEADQVADYLENAPRMASQADWVV